MEKPWIDSFNAGIFTEFQEQRSPGHTAGGDMIYKKGFNNLKTDIAQCLGDINFFDDSSALEKLEVLKSFDIAVEKSFLFLSWDLWEGLSYVFSEKQKWNAVIQDVFCHEGAPENQEIFVALTMWWHSLANIYIVYLM